ncbi:MAG: gluconate 2-dehydrogenase subunit 3 family protein, partial [Gemmatimonadaceae bacterium]
AEASYRTLDRDQLALVTELAELIIPETDTPGATRVRVPEFIDLMLTEWATDDERAKFLAGLADIDKTGAADGVRRSASGTAQRFVNLPAPAKHDLIMRLDAARDDATGAGHAFGQVKQLTVYAYFTSKPVVDGILKTQMFFDGYHGNVPFTPAT